MNQLSSTGFYAKSFHCRLWTHIAPHQGDSSPSNSSSIALPLDQEKAYDRVHPEYICSIIHKFGMSKQITSCIYPLFFSTNISINVNGHLITSPLQQLRGLRQGDPLGPFLFNLTFDSFLRLVSQDKEFKDFQFSEEIPAHSSSTDHLDNLNTAF